MEISCPGEGTYNKIVRSRSLQIVESGHQFIEIWEPTGSVLADGGLTASVELDLEGWDGFCPRKGSFIAERLAC